MAKRFVEGRKNVSHGAYRDAEQAQRRGKLSKKELRALRKQEQQSTSQRKRHGR